MRSHNIGFYEEMVKIIFHLSFLSSNEPRHEKINILHMRKQRRRSASRVTAKLISAFVFATRIVLSLYFLNPKFKACSHFL